MSVALPFLLLIAVIAIVGLSLAAPSTRDRRATDGGGGVDGGAWADAGDCGHGGDAGDGGCDGGGGDGGGD